MHHQELLNLEYMSSLTIRKKSVNTWLHNDSVFGDFIISKFYFNSYYNEFQIVEEGNSRLSKYAIGNITLYDDTDGGTPETFSTITELSLRLEELLYPAFDRTGMTIFPTMEQITNVNVTDIEDGQVLIWDAITNKWINTTIGVSTTQVTSKVVYCTLADVGATSPFQEDIDALVKDWVVAQNITKSDNEVYDFVLVDELPTEINFDIEATDWASQGITDEASFIAYLISNQGATNVVVNNFSLVGGVLQCYLSFDGTTEFYLQELGITKINNIEALASLTKLFSELNSLVKVENLNSLVNLEQLFLDANNINEIDENLNLSNKLTEIGFTENNFTTADYTTAEAWATNQPSFINPCTIYFANNPDSPIGTTFEAILLTKNATLIY